jgi:hypothetical protein
MKKILSVVSAFILAIAGFYLAPLPASALTSSDVTASLSVINGNLSTTLNFTGATPSIVTSQNLNGTAGRISFDQIRVLGHDSAVSATAGSSNVYSSLSQQSTFDMYTMVQPSGFTIAKSVTDSSLTSITKPFISLCWWGTSVFNSSFVYICTPSIANPNIHSVVSQPTLTLNGSTVVKSDGVWSGGNPEHTLFACGGPSAAQTSISSAPKSSCNRLAVNSSGGFGVPTNLSSAWVLRNGWVAYNPDISGAYIVLQSASGSSQFVWTDAVQFSGSSAPSNPGSGAAAAAPIKYSGPEFSELSLKPALAGSSATLEGRKLDQISSVTIGGKAAVLSNATDKSVNIGLPAGLAPGVYDLVVNTANHGKLTHMNSIRVREVLPATSLTIKGSGVLTGEEFKKLTAFSRTQNPDMNTVTCIVNSNSEGKSFMQARALCDRISATNQNIKNTKFEARSTVEGSAIFARVVFSSEQ